MKSGYDQHFKKARQIAQENPGVPLRKEKKPTAQSRRTERMVAQKLGAKRNKNIFISLSLVGAVVCVLGLFFGGEVEKLVQKIDISWVTSAQASDVAPAVTPKAPEAAAPAEKVAPAEYDHFAKLQERKKELDSREEELVRMDKEIQSQKLDLEKRMAELEEMRSKISAVLDERIKTDEKKVESLVQVYTNMRPPQAAKVFETLDEDLAIEILGRMKKKSAADIMNLLKSEKAQAFSERMAGYRVPAGAK